MMFLEGEWRHLCIDMQRMFAEDTPWRVEWMERVLPQVEEVSRMHADRTMFTRFVPPVNPAEVRGTWHCYYLKWRVMTREHLGDGLVDLVPSLRRLVPPARVYDKSTYSPWIDGHLHRDFQSERVSTVILSGGETDVCVLATALGAIDLGYRVIALSDGVCSGADDTHDAALKLLGDRFSLQLEVCTTDEFLSRL